MFSSGFSTDSLFNKNMFLAQSYYCKRDNLIII